ncbi:acyl-CoA dehydrogenase family protein [Amycolatopsis panacis]|uniref:Flavin-dependent monooxygenase n=1 Tax=Amycolatopsis panacis TaxID=2340917 RepID=A0A419HVH5_9PSEU|nr:flavin-dependent monooxygenase [Amycolatopsis panacis]RJQ80836.1 flavin-dependent monooxygenase [Amycolatopsis panacis]
MLNSSTWQLALFDARAQEDVWGEDPDARICISLAPMGEVRREGGGFRLSGRWSFAYGSTHAGWALLSCYLRDDSGKPLEVRTFLVPAKDYRIEQVRDTVGLRGTSSNDILVDNAFIPPHRTISAAQLASPARPGYAVNPEPSYRLALGSVFTSSVSAPLVGVAESACAEYLSAMRIRTRVGAAGGRTVPDDPFAQIRAARAASEIDAAWLQLSRNITDLYACAQRGEQPALQLRTRLRRDQVLATERATRAVDLLMENAGGHALRIGDDALQRAWRDIHTGRGHTTNDPEKALVLYGREAFGLEVHDPML